jgi:hypothetical protein
MAVFIGILIVGSITTSSFLLLIPMCVAKVIDALNHLVNGPRDFSTSDWFFKSIAYWWIGIIAFVCTSGIVLMFNAFSSDDSSSSTKEIPKLPENERYRGRM